MKRLRIPILIVLLLLLLLPQAAWANAGTPLMLGGMFHLILTSEAQLRYVVKEFLEYYNHERPHSGLGGNMIKPWPQDEDGEVTEFSRLGGLLKSYRRVKKAA